ncbi:hypothetical protein [Chryseobacterium paridis]|uniref:T9SS C-terminal target domain-containing protein n=1 Tax=Chryseobacterium paridis TaxID=2800328 RepID=A0ABS1FZ18_9FLAO|nr:hypothetical protein [Chryseobacterium paridis]MBK1897700.1 hypothetical protein [Chryseobacterium paridis]
MKRNLLTATMLVSFGIFSQAQQRGVGINTTKPAATLDVVADIRENAMPDAILAPRMTAAQLLAKDNTSGTYGAPQNGAIVYITSGSGNTDRTSKIRGAGFYYFDSTVPEWKNLGGGSAVTSSSFRLNLAQAASPSYNWDNSDFDFWEFTSGTQLTLPTPASYNGRTIHIRNQTGGTVQFSGTDGIGTPKGIGSFTGTSALQIHSNGTNWYMVSGRS